MDAFHWLAEMPQVVRDGIHNFLSCISSSWTNSLPRIPLADKMPAMMPSIRSVTSFALSSAQIVFLSGGNGALGGTPKSCPVDGSSPLSCQNTTVVPPSCCFNAPGGQFLLTQFWDANPPTGPIDSWTVHGLWYGSLLFVLMPTAHVLNFID